MQNNFYFINNYSNIYKKPSKQSEVTSQIIYGEKFKILAKNKSWIKIKTLFDNYKGFIKNSKYVEIFSPNYKVSSLKAKIFKKPGIGTNSWLPLASKLSVFEQNRNYVKIEKNKWIKKGDIIFWKGHVAMCLNSKQLIHAYGPEKKVIIMPIIETINRIQKTANLKVKKISRIKY